MSAQLAATSLVEFSSTATPEKAVTPKLARHARKCIICHHANRPEIEDDFLHWRPCTAIASSYGLPDRRAVYRHARATGLYRRRMRNMRIASSYIVQHAERIDPSAQAVLNAVRACSVIDASGVWNEPVQHVIVEHRNAPQEPLDSPLTGAEIAAAAHEKAANSNVYSMQLEFAATPTKQTPPPTSNVYFPVQASDANSTPDRDALPLVAAADKPSRPTSSRWMNWCPNFLRNRFENRSGLSSAHAGSPPPRRKLLGRAENSAYH